jgi:hypothetical protein
LGTEESVVSTIIILNHPEEMQGNGKSFVIFVCSKGRISFRINVPKLIRVRGVSF